MYTDGSKDPESGCAGSAVYIPVCKESIKKRLANNVSVYRPTTELVAIVLALQWLEEKEINNAVIASDSFSALESIKSGRSACRMDLVYEIFMLLTRLGNRGTSTCFMWVPAHVGVDGNEQADILAKQTLSSKEIDIRITLSRSEVKPIIRTYAMYSMARGLG